MAWSMCVQIPVIDDGTGVQGGFAGTEHTGPSPTVYSTEYSVLRTVIASLRDLKRPSPRAIPST